MDPLDVIIELNSRLEAKDQIIMELNLKINKLEKLNNEMTNVIRFNTKNIDNLSEYIRDLKQQISKLKKSKTEINPENNIS